MNNFVKVLIFFFLMTLLTALNGCGTTKKFAVESRPNGALLLVKPKVGAPWVNQLPLLHETPVGETPLTAPLTFFEDNEKVEFVVQKRGYASSSALIDKNSLEKVMLELKRLEGVPESSFRKEQLHSGAFTLLPLQAEVIVHSGVGRLDTKESSPELSDKVTADLNAELEKALAGNKSILRAAVTPEEKADWLKLAPQLNKYFLSLNAKKLQYYEKPPLVVENVPAFKPFMDGVKNREGKENPYFLYIRSKCVTETGGRVAGNIALALLGAASQGASRAAYGFAPYYDYSAFDPDSGTLAVLYVIDAQTSEVVHMDQQVFGDITEADDLKSMVDLLAKFPRLEK